MQCKVSQILLNVREVLVLNCKRVNDHAAMNDCIGMVILINILKKKNIYNVVKDILLILFRFVHGVADLMLFL